LPASDDEATGMQSNEPPFSLSADDFGVPAMLPTHCLSHNNPSVQLGFNFGESKS
jgi:hypothetical protein